MWWCESSFQTGNNTQCHWMVITTDIRIWCSQPFQTSSMPKKRLVLHYSSKDGALVQWLKLPAWKVEDRGFKPPLWPSSFIETNCFFPLTRNDSILSGTSVRWRARPQTARAWIPNPVSGGQCHLLYLTILRRLSWSIFAYMCTKVA